MTYKDISDSRTRIMGVAIIWILLFHMEGRFLIHGYFPGLLSEISAFIIDIGSIGVELFVLCSGFGLCFSIRKNPGVLHFYTNRVKRILPEFTIGLVLVQLMDKLRPIILILEFLTISYYFKESCHFWFISAIVLMYLVFPFIYRFLTDVDERTFKCRASLMVVICALLTFVLHFISPYYEEHLCMIFDRFTVFIIGVIIGVRYDPEKKIAGKKGSIAAIIALEALLIAYMAYMYMYVPIGKYTLKRFIFVPLSVSIVFLLVKLFTKIKVKHSLLSAAGKISLSLYIADGVYATFSERAASYGVPYWDNALASIPFIITLAVLIHLSSEMIRKAIKRVNQRN